MFNKLVKIRVMKKLVLLVVVGCVFAACKKEKDYRAIWIGTYDMTIIQMTNDSLNRLDIEYQAREDSMGIYKFTTYTEGYMDYPEIEMQGKNTLKMFIPDKENSRLSFLFVVDRDGNFIERCDGNISRDGVLFSESKYESEVYDEFGQKLGDIFRKITINGKKRGKKSNN